MTFADRLQESAQPIWEAQIAHPFVKGISDGSLDKDRFRRWLLQDYLYLQELARVFAWAVAKADRLDSMRWYGSMLHLTLEREMELHRSLAGRFTVSEEELERAEMLPTTRAYADFLIRTAAAGDLADLVAALLPCAWGYVVIARQLAADGLPEDPRYAAWIEQYAADEFAEVAERLKNELNRLVRACDERKRGRLRELFLVSSRYEWQFWEMCWHGEERSLKLR